VWSKASGATQDHHIPSGPTHGGRTDPDPYIITVKHLSDQFFGTPTRICEISARNSWDYLLGYDWDTGFSEHISKTLLTFAKAAYGVAKLDRSLMVEVDAFSSHIGGNASADTSVNADFGNGWNTPGTSVVVRTTLYWNVIGESYGVTVPFPFLASANINIRADVNPWHRYYVGIDQGPYGPTYLGTQWQANGLSFGGSVPLFPTHQAESSGSRTSVWDSATIVDHGFSVIDETHYFGTRFHVHADASSTIAAAGGACSGYNRDTTGGCQTASNNYNDCGCTPQWRIRVNKVRYELTSPSNVYFDSDDCY
jgi:hypothetical protein